METTLDRASNALKLIRLQFLRVGVLEVEQQTIPVLNVCVILVICSLTVLSLTTF